MLLEREADLGQLVECLRAARAGVGSTVAVEGVAGIGKSRLLAEADALAREHGMLALSARGGEVEQELPYGIVRQLLSREVGTRGPQQARALLSGAAALAAPALGLSGDHLPSEGDQHAALHGLS